MSVAALESARQHYAAGRYPAAEAALRRALASDPRRPEAHNLLGAVLLAVGKVEAAVYAFQRAGELAPGDAAIQSNWGSALFLLGRAEEAREPLERAVALDPHAAPGWLGLASVLNQLGLPAQALEAAERAFELAPHDPSSAVNRAAALVAVGRADEAAPLLADALQRHPTHPRLIANYLSTLHYTDAVDADRLGREHARLGPRLAAPGLEPPVFNQPRDPERRVRVAYFSSDLRGHSVAAFAAAFLPHHDRDRHEVLAVHTGVVDDISHRLRAMVDRWIDARGVDDTALVGLLRRERVDVLVELNGHTQGARPGVIAARAAPVQLTYLGYPDRTGVPNVDGRIVDAWTDPAGAERGGPGMEPLIRLPRCFLAYSPPAAAPAPRLGVPGEPVTFGSFNALAKLGPATLRLCGRVLAAVPGSRLVLKNRGLDHPGVAARVLDALAAHGVAAERVELIGWQARAADHWSTYARVDVALDPYPYHGTTTTCEALWMGVPVVSRVGGHHAARVGASLLHTVGLDDLAATDDEAYVAAAAGLARDAERRATLRRELRDRVAAGPLGDGAGLARALESVYRSAWRSWCASAAGA